MLKLIKWLFGLTAFTLVSVILLIVYATTYLDPNDFRDEISQTIKEQTGLTLNIEMIEWSLFPWLGLDLERIAITSPESGQLANVSQIKMKLKLIPLLDQRVEVSHAEVIGSEIYIVQNTDHSFNWEIKTQSSQTKSTNEKVTAPELTTVPNTANSTTNSEAPSSSPNFDIIIGKVAIENGKLNYKSKPTNSEIIIDSLNFQATDIALSSQNKKASEFPIRFSFNYKDNLGATISPNLTATVRLDPVKQSYHLNNLSLENQLQIPNIAGKLSTFTKANIAFSPLKQTLEIRNLSFKLDDLISMEGEITATQLNTDPTYTGTLNLPKTAIRPIAKKFNLELPKTASVDALDTFDATLSFAGNTNQIKFSPLNARLDQTNLSGFLEVKDIARQVTHMNLVVDQINLDNYLPPTSESSETEEASTTSSNSALIPVELVRSISTDTHIKINKLETKGIVITDTELTVRGKDGYLTVDPLKSNLLEGDFSLGITVDARGDKPKLAIRKKLNSIQVEPAIKAMADSSAFAGLIFFGGDIETTGNDLQTWKKSLTGTSDFKFSDGILRGLNLTELAYQQLGSLGPLVQTYLEAENSIQLPPAFDKDSHIRQLAASVVFDNGIARTNNLSLSLDNASANGDAAYDMVNQSLEFNLNLTLNESISNAHIAQINWPIHCTGNFETTPSCRINSKLVGRTLEKLAKQAAKEKANEAIAKELEKQTGLNLSSEKAESELKQKVDEQKDEVLEKLDDKLKERFKGLF